MNMQAGCCPSDEDLCSLFDGEAGNQATRLRRHVACCPRCGSRWDAFAQLRQELAPLRQSVVDPGIAEAVLLSLPRRPPRPRRWMRAWYGGQGLSQWGTRVLGGVAALTAGSVLGLSLFVGGGVADRSGMSVFAAEPVRQLCAGLPSCGR